MLTGQLNVELVPTTSTSANVSQTPVDLRLRGFTELNITLLVTAADRTNSDETYDVYITSQDAGGAAYDLVHFPQIATTGVKTYTARLSARLSDQNVTSATPGVAANDPGTLRTDTAGSNNGIRTLAAGLVRQGGWGNSIGHEVVVAGTTPGPFTYRILINAS